MDFELCRVVKGVYDRNLGLSFLIVFFLLILLKIVQKRDMDFKRNGGIIAFCCVKMERKTRVTSGGMSGSC